MDQETKRDSKKMHMSIEEIVKRSKSIEEDLRALGLDSIELQLFNYNDNEWYRYSSDIRLSDVKVNVYKLQLHHKKLTEDIQKCRKSIKALNECLATQVSESEINKVSARRNAIIQKLESKQKEIDNHLLSVIKKIEELG